MRQKEHTCTDYVSSEDLKFIPSETNETFGDNPKNPAILGRLVGTHFVPCGESRNGRWYSKELWYEQLEKPFVKERLTNNSMLGTIGHALDITENQLRDGLVSHYTTNLRIEPTGDPKNPYRGIGESVILATPAGKMLKTYLDAGVKFWVSSRADGDFLPGQFHRTSEGKDIPILDKDKFRLDRFDMVLSPGFLQAKPELQESLGVTKELLQSICESYNEFENNIPDVSIKENSMKPVTQVTETNDNGNELITKAAGDVVIKVSDDNAISITKANATPDHAKGTEHPHGKISSLHKYKGSADAEGRQDTLNLTEGLLAGLLKQNEELKEEVKKLREAAVASDAKPDVSDLTDKMVDDNLKKLDPQGVTGGGKISKDNTQELLASIKEKYGELEDVCKLLDAVKAFHETWGDPKDIITVLESARDFHEEYGSQEDIAAVIEVTKSFNENVGTPDAILFLLETYEDFFNSEGSPEEISEMCEFVESFGNAYGPFEKIAETLDNVLPLFDEVGGPDEIRANKQLLEEVNRKISAFQNLGIESIEEMRTVLQEMQDIRIKNEALSIAEHTGLNSKTVLDHLKNGMSERQIVDFYNNDLESGSYRKFLTIREDASNVNKLTLKAIDPDGDHVQLQNAFYTQDLFNVNENESVVSMAIRKAKGI